MFLLVFAVLPIMTKAQFEVSGEFRPRLEYRDGYRQLRDSTLNPYATILGRARIIFDYKNEKFTTRFTLQQAFVYGENNFSSDTITRNTVNIFEAWFRYHFTKQISLSTGRINIGYDDNRILGSINWRQWGSSHDLVLLQWQSPGVQYRGDFGFAINNNAPASSFLSSYSQKFYKYMAYLWEQKKFFGDKLTLSLMAMMEANQKQPVTTKWNSLSSFDTIPVYNTSDSLIGYTTVPVYTSGTTRETFPNTLYARVTAGGNLWIDLKRIKLFFSGYYQFGHIADGRKTSAWLASGKISWNVVNPFTLTLGADLLSGNNYSDTEGQKIRKTGFTTPYISAHAFYGYMDMFAIAALTGNHAGLNNLYGRASLTLKEKTTLELTWHWFGLGYGYLPAKVSKPGDLPYQQVSRDLGSEIDLMVTYKPIPRLDINAAYCFFLPTSTMEIFNGITPGTARFTQFAYLMVTYKPSFFTSSK